jgi:hypothetical protein
MLILNMVCLTVEPAENEIHDQENRGGNEGRNNVQGRGTKVRKSTSMQHSLAAFLGASMVGKSVGRSVSRSVGWSPYYFAPGELAPGLSFSFFYGNRFFFLFSFYPDTPCEMK